MKDQDKTKEVSYVVAKIHAWVMAFVMAVIFGVGVFIVTALLLIKGGPDADEYLAFTRKLNLVMMFPSANDMTRKITKLAVERIYNLQLIGLPLWVYEWSLRSKKSREKGRFAWWRPSEVWGVFNTEHMPYDDAGISIWLEKHIQEIIKEQP